MDSSHVTWFNSLFDEFKRRHRPRASTSAERREEAFLCVQLIATAYASAREGSRELPLGRAVGRAAWRGDDVQRPQGR